MPTVALNGRTAPGLTCPADKVEIVYWSNDLPGFGLRIRAGGAKAWLVMYRTKTGEQRKATLGDPASVPFQVARKRAAELIASAKTGGDPHGEARRARNEIKTGDLVERYLARQKPRMRPRSYEELRRHLETHARPLHGGAAARLTQRAIAEMLQRLAEQKPITANRVRASLSAMFTWAMRSGLVSSNPIVATFKPAEERTRERVLSDDELRLIWGAAGDGDHGCIVRLLMLTGARREEVAGMRWSEIIPNDDGTAVWTLPSERSKNNLPHMLTLPAMVIAQLPALRQKRDGQPRDLLFGEADNPYSGWSRSKERLDRRIAKLNGGEPIAPWVLHDLRRTFVSRLNDRGIAEPHIIEALVNHQGGIGRAGIAGVYNRAAYRTQKAAALARWADHIAGLTAGGDGATGDKPHRVCGSIFYRTPHEQGERPEPRGSLSQQPASTPVDTQLTKLLH